MQLLTLLLFIGCVLTTTYKKPYLMTLRLVCPSVNIVITVCSSLLLLDKIGV